MTGTPVYDKKLTALLVIDPYDDFISELRGVLAPHALKVMLSVIKSWPATGASFQGSSQRRK